MKSALPKVLHPVAGRPMIEHVLQTAESLSPATVTRDRRTPGRHRSGAPGEVARACSSPSRSLSWGPRTPCSRPSRCWPAGPERWSCSRATCRSCSRRRSGGSSRRTVAPAPQRPWSQPRSSGRTATAASSGPTGGSRESSRNATPRRPSGRSRDQQRHLRLRPRAAVRRAARHRLAERAGRVLPDRPDRHLPAAQAAGRDARWSTTRRKSAASTAAPNWRK